ncbi:hypothetical protein HD806DRAFT_204392 [Xylariaceae sp. AK1471]|nr:hypothetical protein HD806DRAFT_204392 [Xylariaceae sp. AK1471]
MNYTNQPPERIVSFPHESLLSTILYTKADSDLKPTVTEKGLATSGPAFFAAAEADGPNVGNIYTMRHVPADYATLPTKLVKAVKFATGYESEELFRIGYILLMVQEWKTYALADLAHVVSSDWDMPTSDLDLIDRVRDMMALPCRLAEVLSQAKFTDFVKHVNKPLEVRSFLRRLEHLKTLPRDPDRTPILPISDFKVILCAEIWCTWAHENRSPLPSKVEFVELFGPEIAVAITIFVRRFAKALTCPEFQGYILQWYGFDVLIPTMINELIDLVEEP